MRFLKLLAEVGVGLGTFLNGYCPEVGPAPTPHGTSINGVCETWGNAVDTFLYNIEPEVLVTKAGSMVAWDALTTGGWQSGLASLYNDWSLDLGFIYGSSILDTGGTSDEALPPGEVSAPKDVYTGPKEIMLAPCIICKVLPDAPTTTPGDAAVTPAAIESESGAAPAPSAHSADIEQQLVFIAFVVVFWVLHIWIMLYAAERTVIDTHAIPFVRKWIARPVFAVLHYVGWMSFGEPIPWPTECKFIIVTKDGRFLSMARLSRKDYILARGVPLVDDEELETKAPAEPEREPPARVWHPDMHVSTSGRRESRRGQKKAAKMSKTKKKSG
ncbi:hypothetical protein FOMPIDRAFT_155421 [Fomitopsis schrenkii]|uniref:Uncharacterized protein n=1 Tax=Fomitopsis schrenkii TaxID=2126942 RepID=S8FB20_FOMSC|nr:hypothetical protein FOMPIDRAFT_155421 [Fomitopsis schrenkii]